MRKLLTSRTPFEPGIFIQQLFHGSRNLCIAPHKLPVRPGNTQIPVAFLGGFIKKERGSGFLGKALFINERISLRYTPLSHRYGNSYGEAGRHIESSDQVFFFRGAEVCRFRGFLH